MIRQITIVVAATLLLTSTGCRTLALPAWSTNWFGDDKPKVEDSKYSQPARIVAIWSPAMYNSPGKKPTRGFGGRIYFYDAANKAVPVEGQLVVYGYNDTRRQMAGQAADRKYAFTPEQFSSHYAPTELGASYSIWIPWDAVGNEQTDVSLVPIFTATSGQVVMGQPSKNLLPGPTTVATEQKVDRYLLPPSPLVSLARPSEGVQQASYQQPQLPPVQLPPQMPQQHQMPPQLSSAPRSQNLGFQETSIDLPNSLANQLTRAGEQLRAVKPMAPTTVVQTSQPSRQLLPSGAPPQVAPQQTTAATPAANPQWYPGSQPPIHYGRSGHPAPSSPVPPQVYGRPPSPQYHAAQPSVPPSSPLPVPATGSRGGW